MDFLGSYPESPQQDFVTGIPGWNSLPKEPYGSVQSFPRSATEQFAGDPSDSSDDPKEWLLLHQALNPDFLYNGQWLSNGNLMRGKPAGRWLKSLREKHEEVRTHKAHIHAAVSVAGVAATIAAIATAKAASAASSHSEVESTSKTSAAVASAAALAATHS